jgi:hypothetical protein
MSKLDRQLDDIWGEKRVDIHWPADQEIDVDLLRLQLISEIDAHRQRVPLDLRGVDGAPEALVALLVELQSYALSQSKVISISNILPPMQEALNPRRGRRSAESDVAKEGPTAGEVARSALNSRTPIDPVKYDLSAAKKIERRLKPRRKKVKRTRREYAIIATVILLILGITGLAEWYYVFAHQPVLKVPSKTFE